MSWLDNVRTNLTITTGDGKVFTPAWINAVKSKEYNVTQFEFPEQAGTLVSRQQPRGRKYDLTIFFQGENHLEEAKDFENSCDDPRAWTVEHPFYGSIIVQPLSLNIDNTKYNVSEIHIPVVETITEDNPKSSVDAKDKISNDKAAMDDLFAQSFSTDIIPEVSEIATLSSNNTKLYKEGIKKLKLTVDAEEYFNLFNKANSAIVNATAEPLAAINELQAVISYPSRFQDSVKNRLDTMSRQFNLLRQNIDTITSRSDKRIYENNAGVLIGSMAYAASTPEDDDYSNKTDVLSVVDIISDSYNTFLADIDSLQTDTGGEPESYIPDYTSISALNALVNFTISNLFDIAIDSKQERTLIVEEDTNIIILAHRIYGLSADDSTIDQLMKQNNIGLNELLGIQKGRQIVYYK